MALEDLDNSNRNIIPRWRDAKTTAGVSELVAVPTKPLEAPETTEFDARLSEWNHEHSLVTASELLNSAIVADKVNDSLDAVSFLWAQKDILPGSLHSIARELVGSNRNSEEQLDLSPSFLGWERLRKIKISVRFYPRDPIAWVDLSREYITCGQETQAIRAMSVALGLAPFNRFVMRSAVRLFVHLDEPDRAHALLLRSDSTPDDPWLVAAEIAVAPLAGQSPEFTREGRGLLSYGFEPMQVSELASALGTLELRDGNARKAKKLFRQSLIRPNENSVAQAGWASTHISGNFIDSVHFNTPRSYEANAWKHYEQENWRESLEASWRWLHDQPFSSRPAVHGSFVASVLLEDFSESVKIAKEGLRANPRDFMLLNNAAVSASKQGDNVAAKKFFAVIDESELDERQKIIWKASAGLIQFRTGETQKGRESYRAAMDLARGANFARLRARAMIFYLLEEIRLSDSVDARLVEEAIKLSQADRDPVTQVLRTRVEEKLR